MPYAFVGAGIYAICNSINGHCYVGSSAHLRSRQQQHFSQLRRGRHYNYHLQAAFQKYGEEAFVFCVLEPLEDKNLLEEREQFYIDLLHPEYNICPQAGSPQGKTLKQETKDKIRQSQKGRVPPNKGKKQSEEVRLKKVGRKFSDVTRRKLSESARKRKRKHRPETRLKIQSTWTPEKREEARARALSRKAKPPRPSQRLPLPPKPPPTQEEIEQRKAATRQKLREAGLGRKLSPETIAKRTATRKANQQRKEALQPKPPKPEKPSIYTKAQRDRMSEGMKTYWARRKAEQAQQQSQPTQQPPLTQAGSEPVVPIETQNLTQLSLFDL
jgi:group I intron endonuclease